MTFHYHFPFTYLLVQICESSAHQMVPVLRSNWHDSVDRCALWHKLLQYCIDGKIFKIIYMYESAKSCVRLGTKLSDHFYSNVGVRSPYLDKEKTYPSTFLFILK